ncbi:MAG: AlpA family phage regulatory protein [Desulfamplus sp.]|nr:AlpA family phage regulatory protein [Desulfamplus sp.]
MKQNESQAQSIERLLRIKQIVPHILPISRSTFYRWLQEGRIPQGFKLGAKTTVWKESDIKALTDTM